MLRDKKSRQQTIRPTCKGREYAEDQMRDGGKGKTTETTC